MCPSVRRIGALGALAAHQMHQLHMTAEKVLERYEIGIVIIIL